MKSAAAQAGLDPALVERAARMLAATATTSRLERLTGGPLRHNHQARFPIQLDGNGAALLLSVVRITAGLAGGRDVGHSSSMGMTWHDGGDMESLSITARPEEHGSTVSVALDRRGTLAMVAMTSGMAMLCTVLLSVYALYPEAPALGVGGFLAGIGGAPAVARGYWASSTRTARERISVVVDAIGQTLRQPESHASRLRKVGDGDAPLESDGGHRRRRGANGGMNLPVHPSVEVLLFPPTPASSVWPPLSPSSETNRGWSAAPSPLPTHRTTQPNSGSLPGHQRTGRESTENPALDPELNRRPSRLPESERP